MAIAEAFEMIDIRAFINSHPFSGFQWSILFLCFLSLFMDGCSAGGIAFIAPALTVEWDIPQRSLGPLFSASLVGLAIGSLLTGPIADRFGRKVVLVTAVGLFGVGGVASAFAHSIGQMTLLRLLTGLGLGAAMPAAITLISEYSPDKRRAFLVTVMYCGYTLGFSLGGILVAALISHLGWRGVFIIGGLAPLGLSLLLARRLPESAKYLVVRGNSSARISAILNHVAPGEVSGTATFTLSEAAAAPPRMAVRTILSGRLRVGTLLLWVTFFMGLAVIFLLTSWMPTLLREQGFSLRTSALVTSLFQFGGTAGALLVGWCMDRFGAHLILTASYTLGAAFVFLMGTSEGDVTTLSVTVLAAGFFMSGSQTPLVALCASFYPTGVRATGVSWMSGIGRWGAVLGAYIGGPLLARGWSFRSIFIGLTFPALLAAVAVGAKGLLYRDTLSAG
jgi:AAHS family 4-hydroxybenzoate transporter-like MFS transporter